MAVRSPVQAIAKPATRDLDSIRSKTEYRIGQEGVEPRSKAELEAPKGPGPFAQKHKSLPSQDDSDLSASRDPDSHHDSVGSRTPADPPRRRHGIASGGSTPRRAARQNTGSSSVEQSPLHPHQLARIGGRSNGVPSPSQERKFSSDGHGSSPSTPWRNRPRSATRGDETPERCAAVPKFGDWDETNAASADGYSLIFSKVREEKQSGGMPTEPHPNVQKQYDTKDISKGCFCIRWGRK